MRAAVKLISAPVELLAIEGAGHDLTRGADGDVSGRVLAAFLKLIDHLPASGRPMV
jgi:hypothetical protein